MSKKAHCNDLKIQKNQLHHQIVYEDIRRIKTEADEEKNRKGQ